jgi:hypothetical protein
MMVNLEELLDRYNGEYILLRRFEIEELIARLKEAEALNISKIDAEIMELKSLRKSIDIGFENLRQTIWNK